MIDAGLRTPTYMELFCLYDREDYMNQHVLDGITGMGYLSSDYFMPFCGALELASGQISGKSQFGGYWGLGANYAGEGVIYVLNADYSMVDYDLAGTNMGFAPLREEYPPAFLCVAYAGFGDGQCFVQAYRQDRSG